MRSRDVFKGRQITLRFNRNQLLELGGCTFVADRRTNRQMDQERPDPEVRALFSTRQHRDMPLAGQRDSIGDIAPDSGDLIETAVFDNAQPVGAVIGKTAP